MGSPARAVDLAKVLEERGSLDRDALIACLAELQLGPGEEGDVALARLLNRRGLVGAAALESALARLNGDPKKPEPDSVDESRQQTRGQSGAPSDGAPKRLGPYLLGKRLGAGSMGAVYEGTHGETGARHAVKTIFLPPGRSAEDLARFKREAALTSRLSHPNIVRIHAVGLERAPYYIAMDLVEGGTLQARLKREGALPIAEALELTIKLASALAHAHAFGVVHRDIKPLNVLVDARGEPRLVDFGLARATGESVERLTLSGEVLGTPLYMAPEQVMDARAVDGRADVYGLGAMLFAMLTGQAPIPGANLTEVLLAVRSHQPPAPSKLRGDVPRELDALVLRALVKDPADRYQSAGDLLQALEAVRTAMRDAPRRTTRRRSAVGASRRRRQAIAAGAALLVVGLVVAAIATRSPDAAQPVASTTTTTTTAAPEVASTTTTTTRSLSEPTGPARLTFDEAPAGGRVGALPALTHPFRLLTLALCDDAGAVQAACTLVLRERAVVKTTPESDDLLEARVERSAMWTGAGASSFVDEDASELRVTYSVRRSSGDVVDAHVSEDVVALARRLAERQVASPLASELARAVAALFDAATWARLLEAAARIDPAASAGLGPGSRHEDEAGLRWVLLGATLQDGATTRRRVVVRYEALRAISYTETTAYAFLKKLGFGRAATLWLLNDRLDLDEQKKRPDLLQPDEVVFDGPAELAEVTVDTLPLFSAPWGMFVGTLARGDVVGAHGSQGGWRRVCHEGAVAWVDATGLRQVPGDDAVVITAGDAWAKVGRERKEGSGIGVAAAGGVYKVIDRWRAPDGKFHLQISYAGKPCWILEIDTRRLAR